MEHEINKIKELLESKVLNKSVIIGLSGGKDSTVMAFLLVKLLGKDRVTGVLIHPYGDNQLYLNAKNILKLLNIPGIEIDSTGFLDYSLSYIKGNTHHLKHIVFQRLKYFILTIIEHSIEGILVKTNNKTEIERGYSGSPSVIIAPFSNLDERIIFELSDYLEVPSVIKYVEDPTLHW